MARGWGAIGAVCLALLAGAFVPGPAEAATWSGRQLTGLAGMATLFGVSCPSSSFCVAVGSNNTVATSTDPGGPLSSWNTAYVGAGAFDSGPGTIFPGRQIRGVSCPATNFCVAVSFEGLIYTSTDPTGGASAWQVADLDGPGPNTHIYGVSCVSATFCVAAAGKGRILTSTNPGGGAAAWQVADLGQPVELLGVSCASTQLCVAVGDEGRIATSTDPLAGAPSWSVVTVPGAAVDRAFYGVACPTAGLCVSGDTIGELLVSTAPTGPASGWGIVRSGATVQITDVDCVSAGQCVAVDNNFDVLTSTNPTGGPGAWTFLNVLPYPQVDETAHNAMFGVSCPAASFCATVGVRGQIFTSADAFNAPPAAAPEPKKPMSKKGRKLKKRPRAVLAGRPKPGIEIHGHHTKARFYFYVAGHAYARGFVCKLDSSPYRPCRSPKSYRVGLGRHVFRVRAIGWTGLRGPQASSSFEVCHPTVRGWCIGPPLSPADR